MNDKLSDVAFETLIDKSTGNAHPFVSSTEVAVRMISILIESESQEDIEDIRQCLRKEPGEILARVLMKKLIRLSERSKGMPAEELSEEIRKIRIYRHVGFDMPGFENGEGKFIEGSTDILPAIRTAYYR